MQDRLQLDRFVVRNFRSILACDVALGPLVFLVGPNGSGKTNFVDAIFFAGLALQHGVERAVELCGGPASVTPVSIGLPATSHFEFHISSRHGWRWVYRLELRLGEGPAAVAIEECTATSPGRRTQRLLIPPGTPLARLYLGTQGGHPTFAPLLGFLRGISTALVSRTLIRSIFEESWDWRREALEGSTGGQRDTTWRMLQGFCELGAPRLEIVHRYLRQIGARFDRIEVEEAKGGPRLRFIEKRPGGAELRLNPSQCSSGVMNAAGVLLELFSSAGSLAVLEGPESLLHRDAVPAIRQSFVAASRMRQVLVTTHDAMIAVDPALPAGCLRTVTQDEFGTRIMTLKQSNPRQSAPV